MNLLAKNIAVTCIILVVFMLLTGCRPTPEKSVVQLKGNLDQRLLITAEPGAHSDEDTYVKWKEKVEVETEHYGNSIITVQIDAQVEPPPQTQIISVIPMALDMDFASKIIGFFFNGEYYDGGSSTVDDITPELLQVKQAIATCTDNEDMEILQGYLYHLEERLSNAVDYNSPPPDDFIPRKDGKYLFLKDYPNTESIGNLGFSDYGKGSTDLFYDLRKYHTETYETEYVYNNTPARGMKLSYQEALKIAQDAIRQLGDDAMAFSYATYVNIFSRTDRLISDYDEMMDCTTCGQCYAFYFVRKYGTVNGVYYTPACYATGPESAQINHAELWPSEHVRVVVSDEGIINVRWHSPTEVGETINDNVAIMPFEDIFEIFKSNIFYKYVWTNLMQNVADIVINDIEYGVMRLPVKDNVKEYVTVPVWCFHGGIVLGGGDEAVQELFDKPKRETFMIINAVDGTIIDPALGY